MERDTLRSLAIFLGAALLAVAGAARAVDGVIEINDASIMAAGGYPAVITTSGSYVLTGNLAPPPGPNAIDVAVGDVTLDLNGFQITGFGVGTGINGLSTGLTVRNGLVVGFTTGIAAGAMSKVVQVRVQANVAAGITGVNCLILESVLEGNGTGIAADRCKIENNIVLGSSVGAGIMGFGNLILHNQILSNASGGILAFGESNIQENVLTLNGLFGISDGILAPPPPPPPPPMGRTEIRGNVIGGSAGPGISFITPVSIVENSVSGNFGSGIACGPACTLTGNQIDSNNIGFFPASGGAVVGAGSNVTENSISFNTGFGLMLPFTAGYSQNTLSANGPLDVINIPPGPHPTSGFMNLCTGIPGPGPFCP